MTHINLTLTGEKIQGVNLRHRIRGKAKELGLTGYVKNMSDGSVYIAAEGEDAAIRRLADWCRSDPGSAQVDDVQRREGPLEEFKDFTIR